MFNIENFDIKLETEFIGRNFIYTEEIDSTNSELLNNKQEYKKTGTVLLAEKQTRGKGRRDRTWLSAKDQNLTFSILLNDEANTKIIPGHINLAASLSVAASIENLYQLRTELKWPNDVMLNKKKVSGILIETSIRKEKVERIVVGFGLNVNQIVFQGEFNYPPTSIKLEAKSNIERENLLAEILNLFEEHLSALQSDPKIVLDDWRSRCKMIGDKITIVDGDKTKAGIFYDIDDNGFLLLKKNNNIEQIHFGDVGFG